MMMTKKLPGCDRAFSSLSPSLPFFNSCNNRQVFPPNVVGASICVVSVILNRYEVARAGSVRAMTASFCRQPIPYGIKEVPCRLFTGWYF